MDVVKEKIVEDCLEEQLTVLLPNSHLQATGMVCGYSKVHNDKSKFHKQCLLFS